jgi:hypothetical protein
MARMPWGRGDGVGGNTHIESSPQPHHWELEDEQSGDDPEVVTAFV